ncbi:MAG: NADH-quinone oxidoreductase subunit C [Patescibacteria group bacterium]
MSTKDFLADILGIVVSEERPGQLTASVAKDKFADAIDELVNARGLVAGVEAESQEGMAGVGLALVHMFATDERGESGGYGVHVLIHDDTGHAWLMLSTRVSADEPSFPAVTPRVMAAYWYERYIHDMFGIRPEGHPDLRRLVHHEHMPNETYPLRKDFKWNAELETAENAYPLQVATGAGVFELTVGPVHAGVAEAAQFCLSVAGERVISLDTKVFFAHKGLEKLLEGKEPLSVLPVIERIAGDAAPSHALAFSQSLEALADCEVTDRAKGLRTLLNELERITLHVHDLAAVGEAGTGYAVLASHGFRIEERLRRLSDELFGNRFWRGVIVPGGVVRDLNANELKKIAITVNEAIEELEDLVKLALKSDGLRDQLEEKGILKREAALVYGAVGVVARASGIDRDVRRDHPYAAYDRFVPTISIKTSGDVYARLRQRVDELLESQRLLQELCKSPGEGRFFVKCQPKDGRAWSAVEGGRGETVHVISIKAGLIDRYTIRGPSFCNWPLLAELMPDNTLSDFPLCLSSMSLSAADCDL